MTVGGAAYANLYRYNAVMFGYSSIMPCGRLMSFILEMAMLAIWEGIVVREE